MTLPLVKVFDAGDYTAHVRRAAGLLRQGGIVILPTETVYGAAALLTNPSALARLRALDPPAQPKPFIIHLAEPDQALRYLGPVSDLGRRMLRKLWPGPVALVFDVPADRQREVAAELGVDDSELYENGTITLRCTDHIVASDVLRGVEGPVVIRRTPGGVEQHALKATIVPDNWMDKVDLILDAGPPRHQKPSTIVRIRGEKYEITRAGVYDQRIVERLLRTTILFVCSGNTCRSPMAEAIARKVLAARLQIPLGELEKKGINVLSAGSFALPGARATPAAVEALREKGLDLSQHRSRPLTVELIHQSDLILTMGKSHAAAVKALVPSAAGKVVGLNPEGDVEDPIGGDIAVYTHLAGVLQSLIERRLAEHPLP